MIKGVYQSCYTNISKDSGGIVSSGWEPVAVSSDIPADVLQCCTTIQGKNANIPSSIRDEKGEILNLYEIDADEEYVYISRTKYGLLDRLGRSNLFAHTYALSWEQDGCVRDPNQFLTIAEENYATDENEAMQIREMLTRIPAFHLNDVLNELSITKENYLTLIKSIYARLTVNALEQEPLYIQYNGDSGQMLKILYCLYCGLPHYLRKQLSVASCYTENTKNKTIVFSINARQRKQYIDPVTADNNILDTWISQIVDGDDFVFYAVTDCTANDMEKYFDRLDQEAGVLGDVSASHSRILQIAYQIILGENKSQYSNMALGMKLNEAIQTDINGSDQFYSYLAELINEVCERDMTLPVELEHSISAFLEKKPNAIFQQAVKKYEFAQFNKLSTEEAVEKLASFDGEKADNYVIDLLGDQKGEQIVEEFYLKHVFGKTLSWDELEQIARNKKYIFTIPVLRERMCKSVLTTFRESIIEKQELDNWHQFESLTTLFGTTQNEVLLNAKKEFWSAMTFAKLDFKYEKNYFEDLALNNVEEFLVYKLFLNMANSASQMKIIKLCEYFYKYMRKYNAYIHDEAREMAVRKMADHVKDYYDLPSEDIYKVLTISSELTLEKGHSLFRMLYNELEAMKSGDYLNYDNLVEYYEEFIPFARAEKACLTIISDINYLMINLLRLLDSNLHPVPIDAWLVVGESEYENAFDILDQEHPKILNAQDYSYLINCKMFRRTSIYRAAEEYVRKKGAEEQIVKDWLGEVKHFSKKKGKVEVQHIKNPSLSKSEGRHFVSDMYQKPEDSFVDFGYDEEMDDEVLEASVEDFIEEDGTKQNYRLDAPTERLPQMKLQEEYVPMEEYGLDRSDSIEEKKARVNHSSEKDKGKRGLFGKLPFKKNK